MQRYLHRIEHELLYPLSDKGYLPIAFSNFIERKQLTTTQAHIETQTSKLFKGLQELGYEI